MIRKRKGDWVLQWWDWPVCLFLGLFTLPIPHVGALIAAVFLAFPGWIQMQNERSLNPKRHPKLRIAALFLIAFGVAMYLRYGSR